MPIFEYACLDCGQTFEILLSSSSDSIPICSNCNSKNLKKLISAHSSMSGLTNTSLPSHGDTTCCGSAPGEGSCAGPGSCCGKTFS